ncbi:hypothetical protein LZ32DRAFT_411695 [Colletotrichum eremochloae]|nr:hypothetical protein LZ32DRAFT_411695 [Colletotrichum eremochloae]
MAMHQRVYLLTLYIVITSKSQGKSDCTPASFSPFPLLPLCCYCFLLPTGGRGPKSTIFDPRYPLHSEPCSLTCASFDLPVSFGRFINVDLPHLHLPSLLLPLPFSHSPRSSVNTQFRLAGF